jgi:hypothetical protein
LLDALDGFFQGRQFRLSFSKKARRIIRSAEDPACSGFDSVSFSLNESGQREAAWEKL